jgi:hypothetical protein
MKGCCGKKARACVLYAIGFFSLISASYGQTFTVAAEPSSLTIYPGQQNVPVTITTSSSTYSGPISVTLTGLPSGITVSLLTLTAGSSGTLELSASLSAGQEGFSATTLPIPTSWTAPVTVVGAAGSAQATAQLSLTISISNASFAPAAADINLPIVNINTNGVGILSKTINVPGTITITSSDGQTSYLPNAGDSDNTATFHVHGHTTATMPKLPYNVKLHTSLDLLGTMGLPCPYVTSGGNSTCDKSKSYILLANYDDKTLLRDWSASALANAIPIGNGYLNSPSDSPTPSGTSTLMPWAPHSLFVELYVNGVYEGNYQLIEQVKVDSHRVNINELSATDTSPSEVTGGYLMEIDQREDEDYVFITPAGVPIGLEDPDFTPEVSEQTSYISNYVDAAEAALFSSNFTDPNLGWRAYFDEASAINFYIVNDVMGNLDGGDFQSSDYLYKDQNNPLIYMGPIWDFDVSSGNVNYAPIVNAIVPWMQTQAPWYVQWFKDPGFRADVVTQWNTLKQNGVFTAWLASIQQEAESLEQSQANNFGRWPMLGIKVWPNPETAGSYDGEVEYLTNWLNLRLGYLDSLFNTKARTSTKFGIAGGTLRNGSLVTLAAQVAGGSNPTGAVSFLSNGVILGAGSLDSSGAASLTTSNLPTGTDRLQAVYNGDNDNELSASTIHQVTVAPPLTGTGPVVSLSSYSLTFSAQMSGTSSTAQIATLTNTGNASLTISSITASADFSQTNTCGTTVSAGANCTISVTFNPAAGGTSTGTLSISDNASDSPQSVALSGTGQDFTLAPPSGSSNSATVAPGQSATYTLSVGGEGRFNQSVGFTCTGAPSGATCTVSPSTMTPGSSATNVTVTVTTTAASVSAPRSRPLPPVPPLSPGLRGLFMLALVLATMAWAIGRRNQPGVSRWQSTMVPLASGLLLTLALAGCGGGGATSNPGTPAGTYTLTVTGTASSGSSALSHSVTLTLTVS